MALHKLLFLVNSLRMGGFERDVAALCDSIDRDRFEPEVWVLFGGGEFEQQVMASGVRVRNLGRRWARSPVFAWKAAREISRCDADLIHAFLPTVATYAALARRWFGVRQPMVLSIGQSTTLGIDRWMFRWCSRTFDWLVANSASAADLGKRLGFAEDRISMISNGHRVEQYDRVIDRDRVRASVGVAENEKLLLCVGRLTNTKRVCDAVAAVDILRKTKPVKLVIVGDGPERGALEAEVTSRGLREGVVFAGMRNDVPDLLKAADLFVFPSETEGLPNALIEASLAGLPIVACRVEGVVDVVTDGYSAVLVSPRSPEQLAAGVRRLLAQPDEASQLAAAGQQHARSAYSIERSLSELYRLYDRLLKAERQEDVVCDALPQA